MPVVAGGVEALAALTAIALLIVLLGLIQCASVLLRALFLVPNTALGWVPWLGSKVKAPIHSIEKKLVSSLAAQAVTVEGAISKTWHVQAWLIEETGHAIWDATRLGAKALWYVEVKYPLEALSALAHRAHGAIAVTTKVTSTTVKRVTVIRGVTAAQLARIGRRTSLLERRLAKLAAHGVGAINDVRVLPARVGYTARQLRHALRRLSRLERITAGLGAVALVGTALGRMGLGWLRCPSLSRVGRRIGCGGFGIIEEFLAPAFEALVVLDLCRFALAAQRLAREFVPALGLVILTADAICLGGGASLPSAHDSKVVSTRIRLPSASD